jgi:CIC family chloride channel protein
MAGVMQAPLTAIFLIAEICGGYQLLFPLIIVATTSHAIMRIFEKYSIYTKRIAAAGELLTHDSDQAVLTLMKTSSLLETDFSPVHEDDTLRSLVDAVASSKRNIFPVLDRKGRFLGIVSLADIRSDMFRTELYDSVHVHNYMQPAPEFIFEDEPMDSVMRKFEKSGAWNLPVVKEEDKTYLGFLSKSNIFNAYRESMKFVSPSDT